MKGIALSLVYPFSVLPLPFESSIVISSNQQQLKLKMFHEIPQK
jgi:hypothetical protein